MQVIISKVLVVFIYLAIGFVCNRTKVLPFEANKYLTSLVMTVTTPCLMVAAISQQQINDSIFRNTIIAFVLTICIFFIMVPITFAIAKRLPGLENTSDANIISVATTSCNCGFMGFPIAQSVFGNLMLYYFVIQNTAFNVYLFTAATYQLHYGDEEKVQKRTLRETFAPMANLVTLAMVVSVIMLFADLHLPTYVFNIVDTIGDITIPLSMMMVGIQLGECNLKKLISSRLLMLVSAIKLVIAPAVTLLVVFFLPIPNIIKLSTSLILAFPSAVIGAVIAEKEGKNAKLMAEAVASTTLLSVITLPIWIIILSKIFY